VETLSVQRLIRPRSVAVIGVSTKLGSAGRIIASNLHVNGYRGAVHLVGRAQGELDGRTVLPDVDALPEGVDLAVFTMPAQAVAEAMAGCVRRKVGAAVVFASGFAEVGQRPSRRRSQNQPAKRALRFLGRTASASPMLWMACASTSPERVSSRRSISRAIHVLR
jgi:acyl-CoA synthetase (NDP forming)